jgi:hypothetical protein
VSDSIRAVHIESVRPDQNVPSLNISEQLRQVQTLINGRVCELVNGYGGSQAASNG